MVVSQAIAGVITSQAEGGLNPRDFRSATTLMKNDKLTTRLEGATLCSTDYQASMPNSGHSPGHSNASAMAIRTNGTWSKEIAINVAVKVAAKIQIAAILNI
uniref:HDC02627 n=1 Tax=Drosophila melanogaster TaxID=7227 RepID=Q6IHG6_DROME|nr:TPA_inf: HDC02627 [Drosophila melanogaster]